MTKAIITPTTISLRFTMIILPHRKVIRALTTTRVSSWDDYRVILLIEDQYPAIIREVWWANSATWFKKTLPVERACRWKQRHPLVLFRRRAENDPASNQKFISWNTEFNKKAVLYYCTIIMNNHCTFTFYIFLRIYHYVFASHTKSFLSTRFILEAEVQFDLIYCLNERGASR